MDRMSDFRAVDALRTTGIPHLSGRPAGRRNCSTSIDPSRNTRTRPFRRLVTGETPVLVVPTDHRTAATSSRTYRHKSANIRNRLFARRKLRNNFWLRDGRTQRSAFVGLMTDAVA